MAIGLTSHRDDKISCYITALATEYIKFRQRIYHKCEKRPDVSLNGRLSEGNASSVPVLLLYNSNSMILVYKYAIFKITINV